MWSDNPSAEDLHELIASLQQLARALSAQQNKAPVLWNAESIADWMGISPRSVARVTAQPDFPKPFVPAGVEGVGMNAQKRWFADEVIEWARRHRAGVTRRGRPRRRLEECAH